MNYDDSFSGEKIDLNSFVASLGAEKFTLPPASVKTNSGVNLLLSGKDEKIEETYNQIKVEQESGTPGPEMKAINDLAKSQQDAETKQGLFEILSDPSVPFENKQKALKLVKSSALLSDKRNLLFTKSLAAASKGENRFEEDARMSSAEKMYEVHKSRENIQALVNAHAASLDPVGAGTFFDMISAWVVPFTNNVITGKVSKGANPEGSNWSKFKSFIFAGDAVAAERNKLESLPPEKRDEYARKLLDSIQNNAGVVFSNDNHFAQYDKAQTILGEGGYNSLEQFLDNYSPLLDVFGIGQALRGARKGTKALKAESTLKPDEAFAGPQLEKTKFDNWEILDGKPRAPLNRQLPDPTPKLPAPDVRDTLRRIEMNGIIARENPASPAKIVQSANPEASKLLHSSVVYTMSDEIAEAAYGTKANEAIASDILPQVGTETGAVTSKVNEIDSELRSLFQKEIHNTGAIELTEAEKAIALKKIETDFHKTEYITINDAMSTFRVDGNRVVIGATFGSKEGAFLNARDAFNEAQVALKRYGVLPEELTVLKKDGLDYIPVSLKEAETLGPGSYMIRVDTYTDITKNDIGKNFEGFTVKYNWFDRLGPTVTNRMGSITRHLFDAASIFDSKLASSAKVGMDRTARFEKIMLDFANEHAKGLNALHKDRKGLVEEYIREANLKSIPFDPVDLQARGFNAQEINVLRDWRKFWDGHYYLENYDLIRTLNSQGYELFKGNNTELILKPIPKNQNISRLYDPASNTVVQYTKVEGDILYAAGGTFAKLRRPINIAGENIEHVIVRNTPTEYSRKMRDIDKVLTYRPGYYQVHYKAPQFIDEIVKDVKGEIISRRAVGVAGSRFEAQQWADIQKKGNPSNDYNVRGDDRGLRMETDDWWDLTSSEGRIAQRIRGQRLEDASPTVHIGAEHSFVLNPVDSAVRAAKSISGRTVMRSVLENSKARFIQQYEDMLPSDGMGGRRWPNSVNEIGEKGRHTASDIADARSVYEYVNYLENGYINSMDNFFKWTFNALADTGSEYMKSKAFTPVEKALRGVGEFAPSSTARGLTFNLYIGTNVLRQWLVQPHQMLRTISYNPQGWASGAMARSVADYIGIKTGVVSNPSKAAKEFFDFVEDSGMLTAVDRGNLVRGSLKEAADSTNKVIRVMGKAFEIPRKIGFDLGEQANLLGHLSAVYDMYKRRGFDLKDKTIRDNAYAETRAISYEMNFAGDLAYNQTSMSMILQFMQIPHKAILQATNRNLSPAVRTRLLAGDLIMWGTPAALIGTILGTDVLPEDKEWRTFFTEGIESMAINHTLQVLFEDDTRIDFSSLAPMDHVGWAKFATAMMTEGYWGVLTNSPAGQLFLKDGNKTQRTIQSMLRYFNVVDDSDESPETILNVLDNVASMSSGWSNAVKSKLALETLKKVDASGMVVDANITPAEAIAQAFGLPTADERDWYKSAMTLSKDIKASKEDYLKVYEDVKKMYYSKLGTDSSDPKFVTQISGHIWKLFADNPEAMKIINERMALDMYGKDQALIHLMISRMGIADAKNMRDTIRTSPLTDDEKKKMLEALDHFEKAKVDTKDFLKDKK